MENKRFKVLNTYVDALTMEETVERVNEIIREGRPTQHVVVNASKVNLMRDDPELERIVNSCPLINADGASIVWAARELGVELPGRVTGIDLFQEVLALCAKKGYPVYLFGARQEVVERVRARVIEDHPGLIVSGFRNGYFAEEDVPEMVREMSESKAKAMFVAFSSPRKEYWIRDHLEELGIPFVMGVGGSFDVIAGVTDRAPGWMQRHGLEWLYRFVQEPRRLWKRYIVGNIKFVAYTLECKRNKRKGNGKW